MSKTPKYLSIDSFSKDDVNDLFNAICTEALNSTPSKIKQSVLKLPGTKKELDAFKPSLPSLITLLETYNIPFEFKVTYIKTDLTHPGAEEEKPYVDPLKQEMEEQRKSIKQDPSIEKKMYSPPRVQNAEVDNFKPATKEEDIPDFE